MSEAGSVERMLEVQLEATIDIMEVCAMEFETRGLQRSARAIRDQVKSARAALAKAREETGEAVGI